MIGILSGIGRVVGREIGEEALGRIIAGRTTKIYLREKRLREG